MANFKAYPVFYGILIGFGIVALGEGYLIYNRISAANKATKILVQKQREYRALQEINPFPTDANKASVEKDLESTKQSYDTMRQELRGVGEVADALYKATVPAEPTDAYFDLATFVQRSQERLKEAGIQFQSDYRFGFGDYASAGPERDLIPLVFRQRQVIDYLINAVVAARPIELISVQREKPLTNRDKTTPDQSLPPAVSETTGSDLFSVDPRISARVDGFVNTSGFRLVLVGTTETLRSLLNTIGKFELPLVVRSVEVEPAVLTKTEAAPADSAFGEVGPALDSGPKPIVEKVISKFSITIELIDLAQPDASKAASSTNS